MSPHQIMFRGDDVSISGDTSSTASSGARMKAAFHPLQMAPGGDGDGCAALASPGAGATADPLGASQSSTASLSAASVASSERSSTANATDGSRHHHRPSLSQHAFRVNTTSAHFRRASDGGFGREEPPSLERQRELEDLVSSLRARLDKAVLSENKAQAEARRHAALSAELTERNASLEEELRRVKEEGREHRALARKVVKDNARLMRESNEREADARRLADLARKVQTLKSAEADGDQAAKLQVMNLSNECESLRLENARLRKEAAEEARKRAEAASTDEAIKPANVRAHSAPESSLSSSSKFVSESATSDRRSPPRKDLQQHSHQRSQSRGEGGRGLQKMSSIRKMTTSILSMNEPAAIATRQLKQEAKKSRETISPEDFLWEE